MKLMLPDIGVKYGIPEELYPHIRGYKSVEKAFGKGYVFHDGEIIHSEIDHVAGTMKVTIMPSDEFEGYRVIWTFREAREIRTGTFDPVMRWILDIAFETDRQWIDVFFNGTDIALSCLEIDVKVIKPKDKCTSKA